MNKGLINNKGPHRFDKKSNLFLKNPSKSVQKKNVLGPTV